MNSPESQPGPETPETGAEEQKAPQTHYFARQPILDRKRQVFGHEFLFRPSSENHFVGFTPEEAHEATLRMVDNSILYNFEWLAAGKAFLNCTREFVTADLVSLLPRKSTVLELPEDIGPDDEVVEKCRGIRMAGYQIALSSFEPRPGIERLLPLADYIKIDFRRSDAAMRRASIRYIDQQGSRAQLIAEKVETEEEFRLASQERFHFFQGFFFCAPAMASRDQIPTNVLNHIKLIASVNKAALDWDEIERLVRGDPALLYRLLRLVNSAGFAISSEVTSVRTALIALGEVRFRKLAMLAITTELFKNKPSELLVLALQRANFCELAAYSLHQDPAEQYLFGIVTLFPALLGASVKQVAEMLPVGPALKAALLGESNGVADALRTMLRYETNSPDDPYLWDDAHSTLRDDDVERWYYEALMRAQQTATSQPAAGASPAGW